jgi:hypothetical protein
MISLNRINPLVLENRKQYVFREAKIGFLNIIQVKSILERLKRILKRSDNWRVSSHHFMKFSTTG